MALPSRWTGAPASPQTWRPETGGHGWGNPELQYSTGGTDVMENFGASPAVVHGTIHGPGYSGAGGITASAGTGSPLADDFHVYTVSWEPGRYPHRLNSPPSGGFGEPAGKH